ncbi:hypothetical protein H0H92_008426 [Tricholoma furcatifolium]|nr:hypothetical protein H0H92_008426 [Tricholoma furcatifolium]
MSQYAPNLVKTLTTLRINASRGRLIQLFHSLVGLGGVLENLIIEDWDPSVNLFYFLVESRHVPEDLTIENWDSSKILSSSFHLPKRFPKLQHVAYNWLHDYPTTLQMDWAKELFHRVTADKASNPLQSLHLIFTGYFEDEQLSQLVPDILSILSINNLGLKLETLHLHLCWSQRFEMAETVLRLCPNLVNSSYLSSFPKAALELLPPSIEHLELPIGMEKFSIKAPDIVHFLQHKRCPALRNLNIYLYWLLSGEVQEIVDYCNEFNLAISRPMRDKKTSSYIRSILST